MIHFHMRRRVAWRALVEDRGLALLSRRARLAMWGTELRGAPFDARASILAHRWLLVEARARVFVLSAGTPVVVAFLGWPRDTRTGPLRLFRRVPYLAPREVLQLYVVIPAFELVERWQQFFLLVRAERRRLAV